MRQIHDSINSLTQGNWFKLICGASYQDLKAIRSLAIAYTLAGVDCIDVAADPAVIRVAKEAINVASKLLEEAQARGIHVKGLPLLMVSLNDGEDPHFRKAEFDSTQCPKDCPRPCEQICPVEAIKFHNIAEAGVIEERCYGCGRCLPVCPYDLIYTRSYVSSPEKIMPLIKQLGIDGLEIHTQVGHDREFEILWNNIEPYKKELKVLAISCQDGENLIEYLNYLHQKIQPLTIPLIWQTDGRPMTGDIGKGTTHSAIKLAQKVLQGNLPKGYIQLAGGTNQYTVTKLKSLELLKTRSSNSNNLKVAGVAYGSYARSIIMPILEELEVTKDSFIPLENQPDLLWKAVKIAHSLVNQLKWEE